MTLSGFFVIAEKDNPEKRYIVLGVSSFKWILADMATNEILSIEMARVQRFYTFHHLLMP